MDRTPDHVDEISLTAEEYEAVHAAVSTGAGSRAGGQPCTLNSLFTAWRGIVAETKEGYAWCPPEFDNDLWCRSVLARVWPLLPPRVQAIRRSELDALDARFRAATIPWPDHDEEPHQWWTRRVPRILQAEAGDGRLRGWPTGWDMMPFPKPECVKVVE